MLKFKKPEVVTTTTRLFPRKVQVVSDRDSCQKPVPISLSLSPYYAKFGTNTITRLLPRRVLVSVKRADEACNRSPSECQENNETFMSISPTKHREPTIRSHLFPT